MFIAVLPEESQIHLETLGRSGLLHPFYLAGGTGAALRLGHRISIDLDFFSTDPFDPDHLAIQLAQTGRFTRVEIAPGTLHGNFNGTRLSFFHYPYPLLENPAHELEINIASLLDIACMKIDAIASRGSRKDFTDLYLICQRTKPLPQLLPLFDQKYRGIEYNKVHILKSLCYFEEADQEPLLELLIPIEWENVKLFFVTESKKIANRWL